jgi:uncharacterized membrane protein YebE (DUF533 family)
VDVGKLLGGMLNQRAGRSPAAGNVLGQVLNGLASGMAQNQDPRYPMQHGPIENIVRESVVRHYQAGGQMTTSTTQWVNQYGNQYGNQMGNQYGNQSNNQFAPPTVAYAPVPQQQHYQQADPLYAQEILLRAMILAAQADGRIDTVEQDRIVQQLQPLTQQEVEYLRCEFSKQHDLHGFARSVPEGMEAQVYQVSLMAMDVDTPLEVQYLRNLASCLRLAPMVCNQYHQQMNLAPIY